MSLPNEHILLRPFEPADASALARLWWEAFHDKLGHVLGDLAPSFLEEWFALAPAIPAGTTLACVAGRPLGYIQLMTRPHAIKEALGLWRLLRRRFGLLVCARKLLQLWISEGGCVVRKTDLYVYMLGVDGSSRSQGLGGRLLAFAEAEARRLGKTRLTLGVVEHNDRAIRLYERFGFVKGHLHRTIIGGWAINVPAYYSMVKVLD